MISALMTVFNGEKYIRQSIESILNQTFTDFELIIVNDGSTDDTRNIIQSYQDNRITLIELKENRGVGAAIKEGLKHVNRDFIAKVDADDIYMKNRFQLQLDYLQEHKNVSMVDGFINYFPDNKQIEESKRFYYLKNIHEEQLNSIFKHKEISEKIYWFPCITHSTLMFRSAILKTVSYNEDLKIGEDYDFYYKLNKLGFVIHKLPVKLADIRVSEASTTVREKHQMLNGMLDIKQDEFQKALNKDIYVWGTGELGQSTVEYLKNKGWTVKGFIDNNLSIVGTKKSGVMVYSKEVINKNSFILVASSYGKFDIVNELKQKKFEHLNDFLVIF
ncbi:glycosyltransferase family 2 protein [Lysinibacillus piscis]|uniref:Glycosyl transferase n=1 Tax=Lysinibacillus piscis TaxID=2518931 RepID=A0ABQ5NHR0_9BACI|nr:glycosyltransferase family 2 protein [Lysinibacillus sp. KH24]GLC87809.1 glycosyl transferase [Lysinibacillus sp. KH24]